MGLGACQKPPRAVRHQPGNVGLACVVILFSLPCGSDAKHPAFVARTGVKSAIRGHHKSPYVPGFGIKIFRRLAIFNPPDFAVGRSTGVNHAARVHGNGEHFGPIGGPHKS